VGDTLFVSDIDAVRLFDRNSGAPLGSRTIRGASFLNDIAVGPDGTVYVTDMGVHADFSDAGTAAVYKFGPGGRAVTVSKTPTLGGPNGLVVDSTGVTVVTFATGEVYRLDPATGARTDLPRPPAGQLDGIVRLPDGSFLISSWAGQAVYRLANGAYTTVIDSVPSPADIGWDSRRNAVLIPVFTQNRVEVRGLE
jgi:sugar lactone lactonase YvrE